jgi:hypothetical protein
VTEVEKRSHANTPRTAYCGTNSHCFAQWMARHLATCLVASSFSDECGDAALILKRLQLSNWQ